MPQHGFLDAMKVLSALPGWADNSFSLSGCQITAKLAFLLTTQACVYKVSSHTEHSLRSGQIILFFHIYPMRSGQIASGWMTANKL